METEKEGAPAWRVVWQEKTAAGRYLQHETVEYAESQSRAVNQALAKLRQHCPYGEIVSAQRYLL